MFTNRGKALTFDDILLIPGFSDITPDAVDITTWLTPSIPLRIPLLSAAMDTVTEAAMAISMARMGGIGIIHKNMPVSRQRLEVEKVKKSESGMILDPVTISPNNTVQEALDLMSDFRVSGLPVVEGDRLVGILTNRDVRFVEDAQAVRVAEVMTSENLVTVPMGTSLEESKRHLHEHRIEKLLVVDEGGRLRGLITMKDIDKVQKYPNACKDDKGRLRVGAAIGIGRDCEARAEQLLEGGADVLVLDSAHGHSVNVLKAIRQVKSAFPTCQLVAGNVATYCCEKLRQVGAKPVTVSDSRGMIYDPEGIDVALLKQVKEVERAPLTRYAELKPGAQHTPTSAYPKGRNAVWSVPCDAAFPSATQNELNLADAQALLANGCRCVVEGANMPSTIDAAHAFVKAGIHYGPAKAANAGGVAISQLEMAQNASMQSWSFETVDGKLLKIMQGIHNSAAETAKEFGAPGNLVLGANIAGFRKVADAMIAQGI